MSEIPHIGRKLGFSLGPEEREIGQASDFLPLATLAWAGPSPCFLPGTVSALTVGYGVDFGALWQIGSWGVDGMCPAQISYPDGNDP